jgi:hypothetical protein
MIRRFPSTLLDMWCSRHGCRGTGQLQVQEQADVFQDLYLLQADNNKKYILKKEVTISSMARSGRWGSHIPDIQMTT